MSASDVDGPCLVATPYNPDWEILPRPELRSMSVCWVLEPKCDGSQSLSMDGFQQETPRAEFKINGKGKQKAGGAADHEENGYGERGSSDKEVIPAYRVLRKVRGLWKLMDLPSQEYIFS